MRTFSLGFRAFMIMAVAILACLASRRAEAVDCTNDIDCPDKACGGQVCSWPAKACQAPNTATATQTNGWCMADTDCKCMSQGATCVSFMCTLVTPPGGSAGSSGSTGGASAGTGGSASVGTGGASPSTGGATTAGTGGAGTGASGSSGGCSIAGTIVSSGAAGLLALGAMLAFAWARRRLQTP